MAYVMIYFVTTPTVVANRLQNLRAHPDLGSGVKDDILAASIIVATDPDVSKVCYATLIPTELLTAARGKAQFKGKGLQEMKDDHPAVYARVAQKLVQLTDLDPQGNPMKVRMDMGEALPIGATVLESDLPLHTFYGYDPWTGEPGV